MGLFNRQFIFLLILFSNLSYAEQPENRTALASQGTAQINPNKGKQQPPTGHKHHIGGKELLSTRVTPKRRKRGDPKPDLTSNLNKQAEPAPPTWRSVDFSTGSFIPPSGVGPRLREKLPSMRLEGKKYVYGFLLLDEYISEETHQELAGMGVKLLGPHSSLYKVRLPADELIINRIAQLDYVEWVGFSTRDQKRSQGLGRDVLALNASGKTEEKIPVIVNLFDDDESGDFGRKLKTLGVEIGRYDSELFYYEAKATANTLIAAQEADFVLFIEEIARNSAHHEGSIPAIGMDYLRNSNDLSQGFDGGSVNVGVLDSGFDMTHDGITSWVCGRDFTGEGSALDDNVGHGSHVLGTLAGRGVLNRINKHTGVAPGVGTTEVGALRLGKIWNRNGNVGTSFTDGLVYMGLADQTCGGEGPDPRPQIVNISGGLEDLLPSGTDALSRSLDSKTWNFQQLYIISAGNEGPAPGTVRSPAAAKNALAVGAVDDGGSIASFSSRGPTVDGRMKPNVVAPGVDINSVRSNTGSGSIFDQDGYALRSGTSMAAPHVTGLAATLMQHFPQFLWKPYLLRSHIMATSLLHADQPTLSSATSGGRNTYGMGKVSAYLSHWAKDGPDGWSTLWWWGTTRGTDNYVYREFEVPENARRLVIVMTWDEPPASAGAGSAVMYDLDLWLDHLGDCPGPCGEYASRSRVDNVEYLIVENPAAGRYLVKAYPWNGRADGLPVGISAMIARGDTTPDISMSLNADAYVFAGEIFSVEATVSNEAFVSPGVEVEARVSSGAALVGLQEAKVYRKDNVEIGEVFEPFTDGIMPLGNISGGSSRSSSWYFLALSPGTTNLHFTATPAVGSSFIGSLSITVINEDEYASNKTLETAFDLTGNENTWLSQVDGLGVASSPEADWYRVHAESTIITVEVKYDESVSPLYLSLYDAAGNRLEFVSSNWGRSADDKFELSIAVPDENQDYYIAVGAFAGASPQPYDMRWASVTIPRLNVPLIKAAVDAKRAHR